MYDLRHKPDERESRKHGRSERTMMELWVASIRSLHQRPRSDHHAAHQATLCKQTNWAHSLPEQLEQRSRPASVDAIDEAFHDKIVNPGNCGGKDEK